MQSERIASEPMPLGEGLTSHVIESRKPILVNDPSDPLRASGVYTEVDQADGAWLGVPMIVGDTVLGVIALQDPDNVDAFTESDKSLLSTLAQSTGVALENARLFGETKRLLGEADQRPARTCHSQCGQPGPRVRTRSFILVFQTYRGQDRGKRLTLM